MGFRMGVDVEFALRSLHRLRVDWDLKNLRPLDIYTHTCSVATTASTTMTSQVTTDDPQASRFKQRDLPRRRSLSASPVRVNSGWTRDSPCPPPLGVGTVLP